MAEGKAGTGVSYIVAAKYNTSGGKVEYTGGMRLGRLVKIATSINKSDQSTFYADNRLAESDGGVFTDGKVTITIDGLHSAAERFIQGLPEPEEVDYGGEKKAMFTKHGDKANPPYLGVGVIRQYVSGGVTTYVPVILTKVKFSTTDMDAETRGEKMNYQTQDLEATMHRDDTTEHSWKWVGEDVTTEDEAKAILDGMLKVAETAEGA